MQHVVTSIMHDTDTPMHSNNTVMHAPPAAQCGISLLLLFFVHSDARHPTVHHEDEEHAERRHPAAHGAVLAESEQRCSSTFMLFDGKMHNGVHRCCRKPRLAKAGRHLSDTFLSKPLRESPARTPSEKHRIVAQRGTLIKDVPVCPAGVFTSQN